MMLVFLFPWLSVDSFRVTFGTVNTCVKRRACGRRGPNLERQILMNNPSKRWKTEGRAGEWEESWCSWERDSSWRTQTEWMGLDRDCEREGADCLLLEAKERVNRNTGCMKELLPGQPTSHCVSSHVNKSLSMYLGHSGCSIKIFVDFIINSGGLPLSRSKKRMICNEVFHNSLYVEYKCMCVWGGRKRL